MGSTSRKGQAQINPSAPEALGICDRCGRLFNLQALTYQYEWRGTTLQNTHLRVCGQCYDVPNEQMRAIILPPDPLPVYDPRVEPFAIDEANHYTISALFRGVASMTADVDAQAPPLIATVEVTAAVTAALHVQRQIMALISGTAQMTVEFQGAQNITALISGTAQVTAALQLALNMQGVAISTTAGVAAQLNRGQHISATISSTASMSAALSAGFVLSPSISSTASMVADLTQVAGAIQARYVGSYAYTFSGTNPAQFTIPSGDLTLPTGPGKQLLFVMADIGQFIFASEIDTDVARLVTFGFGFQTFAFCGVYAGSGSPVISLYSTDPSVPISSFCQVYEIVNAKPLDQGIWTGCWIDGTSSTLTTPQYVPVGGVSVGFAMADTDTTTFTWSNITERVDIDAGPWRVTTADTLTPAAVAVRNNITSTTSVADNQDMLSVVAVPTSLSGVPLGCMDQLVLEFSPGTNYSELLFLNERGDFKLVVVIGYEDNTTVSAITYGGVAMTLIGSVVHTGPTPDLGLYMYGIDVVAGVNDVETLDITFTGAGLANDLMIGLFRLYDVGSVGTAQSSTGTGTGVGVTLNVTDNALVLGVSVRGTASQSINWTGAQRLVDLNIDTYRFGMGIQWQAAGSAGYGITAAAASSGTYATLAVPFQP